MTNQGAWLWLSVVLVAVIGCKASPVRPDLGAVDAESRIAGIVLAADSNDPSQLPALVEALDHDDAAVRFFAIEALERRTGQRLGYESYDPPAQRSAAVVRWRQYLDVSAGGPAPVSQTAIVHEGTTPP